MRTKLNTLLVGDLFSTCLTNRPGKVIRWFNAEAVPVRLLNPDEEKLVCGEVIVEWPRQVC